MAGETKVYILSVQNALAGITIASWVYAKGMGEVFFVDPAQSKDEIWALLRLADRMPVVLYDLTDHDSFGKQLAKIKGIQVKKQSVALSLDSLKMFFGQPPGVITASSSLMSNCIMGAILSVSLGYGFLPDVFNSPERDFGWGESSVPVVAIGSSEDFSGEKLPETKPLFLRDAADYYNYLIKHGHVPNYLLMMNSTDIFESRPGGSSLSNMRVKGLSLLSMILASYRDVFPYDIFQVNPDSRDVEKMVHDLVKKLGFEPKFQAILGAPGAFPFIFGENREIAPSGEEPVRDIHLQLNHDLFFDVAEGRLFQSTPGGLSLQLLSTKHYQQIIHHKPQRVLITATPHVETGIVFDSDHGLIEGKLKPLLEKEGFEVTLLTDKDASAQQLAESLKSSDFFLYSGHGSPKSLNTHRRFFTREDLPDLPPLVAYASACSTMSLRPDWLSVTEGLDWEEIAIPPREVIGLSMVERGAICFIGGATAEDFQFTSSIYSLFLESVLLKGMSVGEALSETRNFAALYGSLLSQKDREVFQISQEAISNIIHQQILLGDPAFVPYPKMHGPSPISKSISDKNEEYEVSVRIPAHCWKQTIILINEKELTREYYRTRCLEHLVPVAPDIISWGDFFHLAFDSKGISEKAVMSGFLHLDADLPPGRVPEKLMLVRAEGRGKCLFCDQDLGSCQDLTLMWQKFVLPYLMLPPIEWDMRSGWPFGVEQKGNTCRVHWLVPVLVIDEKNRRGYQGEKFTFKLHTSPGKYLTGKVDQGQSFLIRTNHSQVQAVSGLEGEFKLLAGISDSCLTVAGQFPLYDLWGNYVPLEEELYPIDTEAGLEIKIKKAQECNFIGKILDSISGEPVAGALLRVWRGKLDSTGYALRECWVGDTFADKTGGFSLSLVPGDYILYITAQKGRCRYKGKEIPLTLEEDGKYEIISLDRAAVVQGKIVFEQGFPPSPVVVIKKYAQKMIKETLSSAPVRNDGTYECLVGFQDRFCIVIEKEGWQGIRDTNFDQGYKLNPEEILHRDYFLKLSNDK